LDALLATLASQGLANAHTVVVSGCSAGGLTALLQTDYIGAQLRTRHAPKLKRFAAAAVSGYFLRANSTLGVPVYEDEIRRVFERGNATGGVDAACVAAAGTGEAYRCISGAESWAHMATPTFIINSAFDYWQTWFEYTCILAGVPEDQALLPKAGHFDLGCSGVAD
jgi:hypothetical protein